MKTPDLQKRSQKLPAPSSGASSDLVRARGYVRHVEGVRGHKIVGTWSGGAKCLRANCELMQPCDKEMMSANRKLPNDKIQP